MAVAHLPSRRPFGQSTVSVYVDGVLMINCPMKFPSLSEVNPNSDFLRRLFFFDVNYNECINYKDLSTN